ncbi:RsmB/NOP family class I SAM-dependent RNA methyltransferase [Paracoccus luteus]|uniref:RsmB/NOP family class I SAM-dependent RNA methyltransferase n=1 Tax=Paracoccus luteus TaxID=2508543 RepID=UPI001C6FF9ED|nr:transcription antitermination factor NusB [Paracoccus luteus]
MDKRDDTPPPAAHARPRRRPAGPGPRGNAATPSGDASSRKAAPKQRPTQPPAPRSDQPHAARQGALRLLAAVRDGATLAEGAAALDRLAPPDRARAQRLAADTLRHRGRADAVLAPLLSGRTRPETLDLLRLSVTEMLALAEAPHGVVNAAVALARAGGPKAAAAAGMVNAVLRRAADAQSAWDAAPPARLPDWLRRPVADRWGEAVAAAIEAAHERPAPLDLTPNGDTPGEALPTGSRRLPAGTQVTALPGYDAGQWWVQDAAAALPALLLDPRPGEAIADLCAAPGGKTMQLAAAGADVAAIDLSPARLDRVAENLRRTGLAATLVAADALDWRPGAPLDAVLLDAPCSATGTIRRHPELPLIRDGAMIPELVALQARLIDHALSLLKPGGRLVYAVCSIHPAEGEAQLAAALARHPGLTVDPAALPGLDPGWITAQGAIRTRPDHWPDRGGLDGFFVVRLRRG